MKETKTTYAYLIEHMKELTFEKVRNIACDFVQKLPSELIDELHDMLNRGVDILDSEPLMQMYFYSYGSMHSEKLTYAFQNLNRYITATSVVDLIDYGCGQGLATMCYHDFILNNNPKQQVRSITLIEPSEVALARAELLCSCFFPNAVITSINKPLDELIVSDINIKGDIPTLHLFSNILDIDTYSVRELSDIIKASYKGDNEFVIVSPMQNAKRLARLKDFVEKLGVNCYFEKYLEKQQLREDKDWTCSAILCSTIDEKYAELYLEDVQTNVDELVDNAYSEKINNDLFRKIRIFSVNGITYNINRDRLSVTLTYGGSEDIDSLTIPETVSYESQTFSVTSIGDSAFKGCSGLASITIPKSVTTIKARAFQDCIGLKSIKIPNSVTSIWYCAFRGCTGLTGSLTIPNSVTSISKNAFGFCSGLTSLIIGNSLTEIEMGVFWNCSGLTSVYIPNSVTSIGNSAFAGCSKLASVTIPDSVSSIGSGAFGGCSGLTSIKVEAGNKFYDSRDNCNAIIETLSKKLILGCKNTVIPNSVTSIGEYAFDGCNELTSITIPNSVNLIDNSAFYGCRGLTSITIPISVTSIGTQAFACCNSLKEVYVKWDNPPIAEFSSGAYRNAILFVPKEKVEIYSCSDGWRNFSKIIEEGGPEAVKWYRKAAEQGNARAQFILGYCYAKGNGVIQSYNEAAKWFRKAAEQGNVRAQFNLGVCYKKNKE